MGVRERADLPVKATDGVHQTGDLFEQGRHEQHRCSHYGTIGRGWYRLAYCRDPLLVEAPPLRVMRVKEFQERIGSSACCTASSVGQRRRNS
jgi:hypothetical protein